MVRPTPLPSPSSDVGAATARPILTNSKPEPSLHPPICSRADAPLMALCCQRSDLASDTPQAKPALSRKACPDPEIESAWQGHQAPPLPAILPGMGQLQPPRTLSAPSLLLGSWAQPRGRCRPKKEEPSGQRVPQSCTSQPLPWGVRGAHAAAS